jgi:ABC-2 type transport system permease protein
VAVLITSGVLAATGVTAAVASLARTAEQAGSWQAVVATLLGLLGGTFFPVAQVGGAMEAISLATPHAWFMRGLGELAGGGGPVDVLPAAGAMLAFAAVTGCLALVRLRRVVSP